MGPHSKYPKLALDTACRTRAVLAAVPFSRSRADTRCRPDRARGDARGRPVGERGRRQGARTPRGRVPSWGTGNTVGEVATSVNVPSRLTRSTRRALAVNGTLASLR